MERKEYHTIDKSEWRPGPWIDEPDKIQWPDEETGLPCLVVRNSWNGILCGYVGVSEDHPYFKKHYHDVEGGVVIHGGLTFSESCHDWDDESSGICHMPGEGEPDHVWWLGFDCGHFYDLIPHCEGFDTGFDPIEHDALYRDVSYVEHECRHLAQQLGVMKVSSEEEK